MLHIFRRIRAVCILLTTMLMFGCAINVPVQVDLEDDVQRHFEGKRKLPLKVGIYIDPLLKSYKYRQSKHGLGFYLNAGEYIHQVSLQMGLQLFQKAVYVNELPPYSEGYRPDVDAVVMPELRYIFGEAIGTLTGHVNAATDIKVTAFDLEGKIIWQESAYNSEQGEQIDFASTLLGGMSKVGKVGYQAALGSVINFVEEFYRAPPKQLTTMLGIQNIAADGSGYEALYAQGEEYVENRNFNLALRSFQQAKKYSKDEAINYHIGVCHASIGNKKKALEAFSIANATGPVELRSRSKKWIERLSGERLVELVVAETLPKGFQPLLIDYLSASSLYQFQSDSNSTYSQFFKYKSPRPEKLKLLRNRGIRLLVSVEGTAKSSNLGLREKGNSAYIWDSDLVVKVYATKNGAKLHELAVSQERHFMNMNEREFGHILNEVLTRLSRVINNSMAQASII